MWVGVDDTDSRDEMCTTYIGLRIAASTKKQILGYPRLVRLNPNIPYKTRGNGAVCMNLGEANGKGMVIGHFGGNDIISYDKGVESPLEEEMKKSIISIVNQLYVHNNPNTNPGIVFMKSKPDFDFYKRCLCEDVPIDSARELIDDYEGERVEINNGRGIIGATASIAWRPGFHTFELICYQGEKKIKLSKEQKISIARLCDTWKGTFNNMDEENGTPSIFPKERTPVFFGIRAINPLILMKLFEEIKTKFSGIPEDFLIYETNQGTDDHIRFSNGTISEGMGVKIVGRIDGKTERSRGGHLKGNIMCGRDQIKFIVFEPSKKFRNIFENLWDGDKVNLFGSISRGVVKVEKLEVLSLSKPFKRVVPVCQLCDVKGKNRGSGNYVCPSCGISILPEYSLIPRKVSEGSFQPPVSARRHLSMPWEIKDQIDEVR